MNDKRVGYFDILRIVSIFFVIVIHVTSVGLRLCETATPEERHGDIKHDQRIQKPQVIASIPGNESIHGDRNAFSRKRSINVLVQ